MGFNMGVMDQGNDSDDEFGPSFNAILEQFQDVEYMEDVLNENSPSGEA